MDSQELKNAVKNSKPVIFDGMFFNCISAAILRRRPTGELFLQAELEDKNRNCVIICDPSLVNYAVDSSKAEVS